MKVTLDLTKVEWCEVANAVSSKANDVRRGRYGEPDPIDVFDPEEWANELDAAYNKIAAELDKEGIPY